MGIRYLNRFLKENAKPTSIYLTHLSQLSGKKIAIDISIYMYRFVSENTLIENIYHIISIFKHYHITPLFVFDGKTPQEKWALLKQRRQDKKNAEMEHQQLTQILENNPDLPASEKQDIYTSLDYLKTQMTQITHKDIEKVKQLIQLCGATYCDAPGEADELCAMLVLKGKVWACISEDTDMFVYGCPRILRYFSLLNHTVVHYDLPSILNDLNISQSQLREICVLSGTDYNKHNAPPLYDVLKEFHKYMKQTAISRPTSIQQDRPSQETFYKWVARRHPDWVESVDELVHIDGMFDLTEHQYKWKAFQKIKIYESPVMTTPLKQMLREEGFLFAVAG